MSLSNLLVLYSINFVLGIQITSPVGHSSTLTTPSVSVY